MQLVPLLLNLLERVLQISAQEAGGAASHQQSKEEVIQTAGTSQNRVIFTASFIDEGIDAWKRQLVDGMLAHMDPTVAAQVSTDVDDLQTHLKEIGFKIVSKGDDIIQVSGPKTAIQRVRLEGFAASNEGPQPGKEKEIAQVIFQTVGTVAGQPELFKQVGAKNLLSLIEEAAKLAGAPSDFKLKISTDDKKDSEIPDAIKQAIMQAQQATLQAVEEKIAKPVAQEVGQLQQQVTQSQQLLEKLKGIYTVAEQKRSKDAQDAQKLQMKAGEVQASEARKDRVAAADIKRKDTVAKAELHIKAGTAIHDAALQGGKTRHAIKLKEKSEAAVAKKLEKTSTPTAE